MTATAETAQPARASLELARQVILDDARTVFGYELAAGTEPARGEQIAELVSHALALCASKPLAERRVLFLHCGPEALDSEHLALADATRIVLRLSLPANPDAAQLAAGAARLAELRQKGFRFALPHDVLATAWHGWLAQADFLLLDVTRLPAPALAGVVKLARQHKPRLLACGVPDDACLRSLRQLGIDLFQGPFFSRPVPVPGQKMRPSQAAALQLLSLVRREADVGEIEALLKRDTALSFQLLRFINSGAFALQGEVTSLRSAVMVVGMHRMMRWSTLLLATAGDAPALGHHAIVRGRLMELLGAELLPPDQCDQAFVTGVFSLLDAMTGVPMKTALEGLGLPIAVTDALLDQKGVFEPFLSLAQACESGDAEAFARDADRLLLSGRQINMAHLQALAWAEDLLTR
ncbi:EAL and HDOD domain-containing protein [Ramlibacter humi]|uniref:HDOD domain-containing protein n=1 Tax=Ramlibacter humi TaxID=2530451 RepID=A0A4Z0BG87_9BURK|nr:HDOD domain-containing protein [Ramlibacter humi]TFY97144.1 HDOD domain-containing protein [Ramlibacter humi]